MDPLSQGIVGSVAAQQKNSKEKIFNEQTKNKKFN